jgi:hypothetical protein
LKSPPDSSLPPNTKIFPPAEAKPKLLLGLGEAPLTRPVRFVHVRFAGLNVKKSFKYPDRFKRQAKAMISSRF